MTVQFRSSDTPISRSLYRLIKGRTGRVFAVRCLGVVALFGFEVTLARSLGVSGYGALSLALAIAGVASRLAPLGWLNASTRLVSSYISTASYGPLKGSLILAYAATAFGLAISVPVLALVYPSPGSPGGGTMLLYVLLVAIALAFLELHRHVLQGLHAGDVGESLIVLLLPALVTALVWGLAVREARTAAEVYTAACLCLALFSGIIIARRLPAPVWRATAEFRTREWSLAALAILMGSASTELIARTSVIVLGALESEREVGLYNAAARLAIMNVFFLRVLTPVAAPRFSVLYSAGQFVALRSMFRQLCLMSLAGGLPCFLLLILFPELVLGWFGHEFVESEATLRVLSVGYLASAATGPCATALMMIGRERAYACLTFGALLASAAANYVLAQHMGALGAAIATAGIMVLNNALYVIVFMRATAPSNARPPS